MCDLYKASLKGENGKRLSQMIRRMAVRFLSADTVSDCQTEVSTDNSNKNKYRTWLVTNGIRYLGMCPAKEMAELIARENATTCEGDITIHGFAYRRGDRVLLTDGNIWTIAFPEDYGNGRYGYSVLEDYRKRVDENDVIGFAN